MEVIKILDDLINLLAEPDSLEDEAFSKVFNYTVLTLGISDMDVAEYLNTSRPTVSRWRQGITQPCYMCRPSVFKRMLEKVKVKRDRILPDKNHSSKD